MRDVGDGKNCGVDEKTTVCRMGETIAGWVKNCRADDKLQGRWNLQRGWKVVGAEIRWSKLWLILWELWKYFFGKKSQIHVNSELSQGELSHRHSKQNVLILVLVVPDEDTSCRCSDSQLHATSF